jgi:replicative DNA helicase
MSLLNSVEAVSPIKKYNEEGWIAKALEEMKDGNIDNTLTSILGRLRSDGYSRDDANLFLASHCERVGAEAGHLEAKIENIWSRYEPAPRRDLRGNNMAPSLYGMPSSSLIIHSPTNPDSIKQFEQLRLDRTTNSESDLRTGYSKLDYMLQGGLKSSRLFTVAARTGTGKTNWLIGAARALCESGKRVLLFSTETPYGEIWQRYIVTLKDVESFRNHQLFICDSFAPNIEKVEEAINEIKPDVFMFDHINHVSEEQRELGSFMQGLNYLRRKYTCAGIVTAQLNRSADWIDLKSGEKVTPRMSMIKSCGTIEQSSSRVLLLSETRVTPEGTEITGNLDKNDNGPRGMCHFMLYNNPYRMEQI